MSRRFTRGAIILAEFPFLRDYPEMFEGVPDDNIKVKRVDVTTYRSLSYGPSLTGNADYQFEDHRKILTFDEHGNMVASRLGEPIKRTWLERVLYFMGLSNPVDATPLYKSLTSEQKSMIRYITHHSKSDNTLIIYKLRRGETLNDLDEEFEICFLGGDKH